MTICEFDEEQARLIETMYATPDVAAQRQFVLGLLDLKPGEPVLDVGSGPGYLVSEMGAWSAGTAWYTVWTPASP